MIIGIIGGGASGMAAAIEASENERNQVVLFERQARVGRKLQATGNGRCNLSNLHTDCSKFHGEAAEFVCAALEKFNVEETLRWFEQLGLYTVSEDSGRIYPYSDHANSVVDILRYALDRPNITLVTGAEVQKIKKTEQGFVVEYEAQRVICDKLIIACGGLAGTKLGGTMSGYKLLNKFGHKCTRLRPALVQIKSDWAGLISLKGVRTNCNIKIKYNDCVVAESTGELQFTEFGLSGPVVFEISRDVCSKPGKWTADIDFIPDMSAEHLKQILFRRKEGRLPASELLTGILHNRLGRVLSLVVGVGNAGTVSELRDEQLVRVVECVKTFSVNLTEPMGMDSAQVTAGGVYTAQFDSDTMESKLVSGLYACGEVLDVDGDCGGYNLQWAWSSGRLAGFNAGRE